MDGSTLHILFIAAEATPFVKVGGLGDVVGSLPPALQALTANGASKNQLDIRLAIPFHPTIPRSAASSEPVARFAVPRTDGPVPAEAYLADLNGLPVYLISGEPIPREGTIYSLDARLDGEKFTFFSLAALELCKALDWKPDILHAHDWHAALSIHHLLRVRKPRSFFAKTRSLFTIHNLPYMGAGIEQAMRDYRVRPSEEGNLPVWGRYQPLPMGLAAADYINTVSPTYSREMLTPEFGCGLEGYLQSRVETVFGILNGLDVAEWDPARDKAIPQPFTRESLALREANKQALLNELGLPYDPAVPLLVLVSRFDRQKGIDLVVDALRSIQGERWQAILLGSGDPALESTTTEFQQEQPERVRVVIGYHAQLSRRLYAGGDLLMMPSRYEPCGLAQMIAMRYGCLPVAHATGGLRDTIFDLAEPTQSSGFLFEIDTSDALAASLRRAIAAYANTAEWQARQRFAMQLDYSWTRSAQIYLNLYEDLVKPGA